MKKNDLLKRDNEVVRVLEIKEDKALVIDCIKRTMPKWVEIDTLNNFTYLPENLITDTIKISIPSEDELSYSERSLAHKNYTLIAGILPFIDDEMKRSEVIRKISEKNNISTQTIRKYLCLYLVYQDISVLIPKKRGERKGLSPDEKNIRWALNKFFYTKNKNSLKTAYTFMLKEKYCNSCGELSEQYPSFYQFRYYYRKHNSLCCGYSLSWEGGVYSIKNLMLNVIADKVEWCKKFGISMDYLSFQK